MKRELFSNFRTLGIIIGRGPLGTATGQSLARFYGLLDTKDPEQLESAAQQVRSEIVPHSYDTGKILELLERVPNRPQPIVTNEHGSAPKYALPLRA